MKPLLRRWRGILATLTIVLLATETLILLSNQTPASLKPVRIEHDESPYSPWLVVRVENTHLSPIRIFGISAKEPLPVAAFRLSRDRGTGLSDESANGWCTSSPCIVVPPLSSREVRIPHPGNPEGKTYREIWDTKLWAMNTSLLSWINRNGAEQEIRGSYDPQRKLPVTGDPSAKAAAAEAARNSCCGGLKEIPAPATESVLP